MKLSIMFYPNEGKASSKTGKIPMYLRITLNRQKAESRLNIEIDREDLLKWNDRAMRFDDRKMSANALLNTIDKNFEDFRHHNAAELSEYSLKAIRNTIIGKQVKTDNKITVSLLLTLPYELVK